MPLPLRHLLTCLALACGCAAAGDPAKAAGGKAAERAAREEAKGTYPAIWDQWVEAPDPARLLLLFGALRPDPIQLSATSLRPGERLKISSTLRNTQEGGAPLLVTPLWENRNITKTYPVGFYSRRVLLIGPVGMDLSKHKPLQESGKFKNVDHNTAHIIQVWPTKQGRLWSHTYDLAPGRDERKPSPGMWVPRLEPGDSIIWNPHDEPVVIPPQASFEVDYVDIDTDGMKQGTYEVSIFYQDCMGRDLAAQHAYFTLSNRKAAPAANKAPDPAKPPAAK